MKAHEYQEEISVASSGIGRRRRHGAARGGGGIKGGGSVSASAAGSATKKKYQCINALKARENIRGSQSLSIAYASGSRI